jgi:hypothetical protein
VHVFPLETYETALLRIKQLLTAVKVRFHLTGGAATIAYGEPRFTMDLDFVVDRDELLACLPDFIQAARTANYFFSEQAVRDEVAAARQFQLMDEIVGTKIDVYPRELVAGELNRSISLQVLPGLELPVASRRDLVMAKLIWISKGSYKSRRDVRDLMSRASEDELQSIRESAEQQRLSSVLDEVLAEADEIIE